jgi:hypothetical protein
MAPQDWMQVLGLGMLVPGGGFLAHADICQLSAWGRYSAFLLSVAAFVVALCVWFGTGNVLLAPMVWMLTALWAASMDHGAIAPGLVGDVYRMLGWVLVACIACGLVWTLLARRQRRMDNAYLLRQARVVDQIFTANAPQNQPEMSLEHLQRLRFALDRALQPLDGFEGFEHLDQFQTAALRYQVNFLGYGIALTHARFTPAMGGYMGQAQQILIQKQEQYRVWSYWKLENLWGKLRWGADPIGDDNIMYTGFVALQMALFQASTGCHSFAQPGAFTLHPPSGEPYAHSLGSLLHCLDKGYAQSSFYLMACEPNWVYPLCNAISATALLAHDKQCGQTRWNAHAQRFRHHLESEFLGRKGLYVPCRSTYTGLALPAIGGVMPLAMPCFFLNALAPDLARRQWLLLRRQLFNQQGQFQRRAFWPIDTGNYGWSRGAAFAATALAAAELGDEEVYQHCMDALESACLSTSSQGVIHRAGASVWAHGVELMARAGGCDQFSNLINRPALPSGPRLEPSCYPQVLVAAAHPGAATGSLQAVLYGADRDAIQSVDVSGLRPFGLYATTGTQQSQVRADKDGKACLQVRLQGRTCVGISPQEDVRA